MAKLREQRNIVKKLYNFYRDIGYSNKETSKYRLMNQVSGRVPEQDFVSYLNKLNWIDRFKFYFSKGYLDTNQFLIDKRNKIDIIYRSCLADGFIDKINNNINISNSGTDLIHFLGFWEIALKKYLTSKLIVNTIITTLLSVTVISLILKAIFQHYGINL